MSINLCHNVHCYIRRHRTDLLNDKVQPPPCPAGWPFFHSFGLNRGIASALPLIHQVFSYEGKATVT